MIHKLAFPKMKISKIKIKGKYSKMRGKMNESNARLEKEHLGNS
jgi:hypothetical protein